MLKTISQILILFLLGLIFPLLPGCSDDSGGTTGPSGRLVTDPYPLAVGNRWEYIVQQSIYVEQGDTLPPVSKSSFGMQVVTVPRTETVAGDEAFGAHHHHVMGRLFATRCDTTVEMHYMAPIGDRVLLKAKETVSNETGGFIPMGVSGGSGPRVGKRVKVGGVTKVIPLNRLARMLLDPAGWNMPLSGVEGPALASDGVQNRDGVIFYNQDFIFVYNELYKGRRWVSEEAPEAGGIEVSQKVTNILDGLEEFEGPIAEVELTNTFIESTGSENTKIRYYYKGGVGVVQAEIYETNILIVIELEDGTWEVLGIGTWSTVKKLVSYTVK